MPNRTQIEKYRPFRIVGKDQSIFRINEHNDVEVFITNARFTTVPDNRWTTKTTNAVVNGEIEYYNEPFEQPEAFTEKERYRYTSDPTTTQTEHEIAVRELNAALNELYLGQLVIDIDDECPQCLSIESYFTSRIGTLTKQLENRDE